MTTEKSKKIRAVLGLSRLSDADIITRLNAVYDGLLNNAAFSTPPVDMVTLKANKDKFAMDIAAAEDGGTKAVVMKNKQRRAVVNQYELLAHYVEANCNDDLATFTSSGFQAVSTIRNPAQPLSAPVIAKAVQGGNSGQLLVAVQKLAGAASYELRWGPLVNNAVANWVTLQFVTTKAMPFDNLTPGATYQFQVRALGRLGWSDWSDPVNRMVI